MDDLQSRLSNNLDDVTRDSFKDAIRVYPDNFMCQRYHIKNLVSSCVKPILKLTSILVASRQKRAPRDFDQFFYEGLRVYITSNVSASAGVTNRRQGVIVRPVYSDKGASYPKFIIVNLDNWTGPKYYGGVPIPLLQDEVAGGGPTNRVKRFPIRQAQAVTLFKVQGRTLGKLAFNFTSRELFHNYSYCGLARVGILEDLIIEDNEVTLSRFENPGFKSGFQLTTAELVHLGVITAPEEDAY